MIRATRVGTGAVKSARGHGRRRAAACRAPAEEDDVVAQGDVVDDGAEQDAVAASLLIEALQEAGLLFEKLGRSSLIPP